MCENLVCLQSFAGLDFVFAGCDEVFSSFLVAKFLLEISLFLFEFGIVGIAHIHSSSIHFISKYLVFI